MERKGSRPSAIREIRQRNARVSTTPYIPFRGGGTPAAQDIDLATLQRRLRREVSGEVRFDALTKAMYATDASNFRQVPLGVVIPKTIDDVVAVHALCREFKAPILPRGAGTSLSGETVNVAVVIDFSKYLNRILDIDQSSKLVRVQPGAINEHVNHATGQYGLIFGPDPSTHAYCTIGGNIGNNSCGVHSVQAQFEGDGGRTSDNLHEMEILTYDGTRLRVGRTSDDELQSIIAGGGRRGEIYEQLRNLRDEYADLIRARFVDIPRRVSGYNLDDLLPEKGFNVARALSGTEGTCATVLEATLNLVPNPEHRALLVIGYEDIFHCGDHITEIMDARPIGCEALDELLVHEQLEEGKNKDDLKKLPPGRGWVIVEFGGESLEEADSRARSLIAKLEKESDRPLGFNIVDKEEDEAHIWKVREGGLGAEAFPPDPATDHWSGWEDSAVPPEKVGPYLRDLKKLYDKYQYTGAFYGHLGQGCIHSSISFDLRTAQGIKDYRSFMEEAADLVVGYGGSLSGEHGDGQQRAELLAKQFGPELVEAFREFKNIWDPDWRMNPGKVVDAYRLDENLKLGLNYSPERTPVKFAYRRDKNDFAHATVRCVGAGKCRIPNSDQVMCPSFMATHEEKDTTRGRARLLFEMMQGDVIKTGWRSPEVKEALDLCLACKGCTNDCPVNVDMPTYKAEFLYHHWARRLRPRHAYAIGFIDQAARIASRIPNLTNLATSMPVISSLVKFSAGIAQRRQMPKFASPTLQQWFAERPQRNVGMRQVLLWPDTFTNNFHPDVGKAAVDVLEQAGFQVLMPQGHVCCGRPLYDYGFLNVAERYLHQTIDMLRAEIRDGTPVVGLEPSCTATFKDELTKLLPNDNDAQRLAMQTYHFAEFLEAAGVKVPPLHRDVALWGHCHQKATGGMKPDENLLARMGAATTPINGGCCGLAGSFGFEAKHYDISIKIGEQSIIPKVNDTPPSSFVVANGFSCRTQIEQTTNRRALHLAELMQIAGQYGATGGRPAYPEQLTRRQRPTSGLTRWEKIIAAGVVGAVAAAITWISERD